MEWVREESRASWQCLLSEWFDPRQVGPSSSSASLHSELDLKGRNTMTRFHKSLEIFTVGDVLKN